MTRGGFYRLGKMILFSALMIVCYGVFAQSDDDCIMCHEDNTLTSESSGKSVFVDAKIIKHSAHRNVSCIKCHPDAGSDFPHASNLRDVVCGNCHESFQKQIQNDIHHTLKDRVGDMAPDCKTCHGTHDIKIPSTLEEKSKTLCGKCHEDNMLSAPYHTLTETNESCIECHDEDQVKKNLSGSVHNSLSCSNCHGYVINHLDDHSEKPKDGKLADCYLCHASIAEEHRESIHGISISLGINEAAQCWDCHGSHSVSPINSDSSKVTAINMVRTCGKCHDNSDFIKKHDLSIKQPAKMYANSIHGKLVVGGSKEAPNCSTCHGIHDIKNRIQEGSKISGVNVPSTCEKCHKEITQEYKESIHWIGVKKGIREAPTCNDCHSEHGIQAISTEEKRHEMKLIQEKTCLHCHQSILLASRYGLEEMNAASYQDSYHGLAVRRGDEDAALCIDCHGVHKILPKYHPESSINENNVTATCSACHEGATEVFSQSYSHVTDIDSEAGYIENIIRKIYIWLIAIVIGGMALHNLIIFIHDMGVRRRRVRENSIVIPRFNRSELIQHYVLLISFIVLAITGFQLKFPDSWWSELLVKAGLDEITRQWVHRCSAVVMTGLSLYHFVYLIITKRGRETVKSLWPRFKDIKLAIQNVLYYMHMSKKHPEFDNHNYIEKAEYWALIWGTIVMGTTGLVLWFPTIVGDWAPVWTIKVSETIHYFEAILASLAIIVWHWFFVIFRPDEYPLSFTAVDGQMTMRHYKEDHKYRFNEIVIEWLEYKSGKKALNKVSYFTKFFMKAVEKNGVDLDKFVHDELIKNPDLHQRAIDMDLLS